MIAHTEMVCALAEGVLDELLELGGRRIARSQMRVARQASDVMVHRALQALRAEGVVMDYAHAEGPRGKPTKPGGWACAPGSELPEALKTRARLVRELRATRQINYSYARLLEALSHGGDPAGAVEWLAEADDLEQHLVAEALARVATGRALPELQALATLPPAACGGDCQRHLHELAGGESR